LTKSFMGNHPPHGHHHHHDNDRALDDKELRREEKIIEGGVHYKIDDPSFIEMTKWPVLLLDTTGSMNEPCTSGGSVLRKDLVLSCVTVLIEMISLYDDSENQPPGFKKGLPIITFNHIERGLYRGFLHGENLRQEWPLIQFHGGTHIMDGLRTLLKTYEEHFLQLPQDQWPLLLCLVITDGELQDGKEFEEHLKHMHGRAFVEIAVVGYGEDHDRALHHYRNICKHHHHVRCTPFTGETDPHMIAVQLLSLVDPRVLKNVTRT